LSGHRLQPHRPLPDFDDGDIIEGRLVVWLESVLAQLVGEVPTAPQVKKRERAENHQDRLPHFALS
jgi:hypothetical protein